jgi:transposase
VTPRVTRRYLTAAYKLKVLDTVAALREQGRGAVGAYLRKEGLYYSSISSWEKLHDQGLLTKSKKGAREKNRDALLAENKQLRRKLEQSQKRLAKTELIIDLQKKLSAIMDIDDPSSTERSDAG